MTRKTILVSVLLLAMAACGGGGSSSTPTSPTPPPTTTPPPPGGGTPTQGTTITIMSNGVMNPASLTVPQGTRVTFINSDSRNRDIQSDPHPTHENCPEIGQVGFLTPGQTRQTGNLNTVRVCGYHDHNDPGIRGEIRIQ